MKRLPHGYYAVVNAKKDGTLPKTFCFKGVKYAVTPDVNAFASVREAYAAASEIPGKVIEGLDYKTVSGIYEKVSGGPDFNAAAGTAEKAATQEYTAFSAPVILFSEGKFPIDYLNFTKSAYFIGQKAGISPNVFSSDPYETPALNPEWQSGTTKLTGSYWKGKMTVDVPGAELLVFDGFENLDARFQTLRKEGGSLKLIFRNIVHCEKSGHTLYNISDGGEVSFELKNIRLCDFEEFDYGVNFIRTNAKEGSFENICYADTKQLFGLTNYSRSVNNCAKYSENRIYSFRHCYFGRLGGENGLSFTAASQTAGLEMNIEDSVFTDASKPGEPFLTPDLRNENCLLRLKSCLLRDTRGNKGPAVKIYGDGDRVSFEDCELSGFNTLTGYAETPATEAPDYIGENSAEQTGEKTDIHEIIEGADFCELDKFYEGTGVSYGDLHVHSDSGGTSDGKTPIENYVAGMDEKQLDFVALVDHRQMRGFFLPAWDEKRMIIGTEPGTHITDLRACCFHQDEIHYNMLFPHKYGLAMVLANFPEFEFRGDELTGFFKYPKFTVRRFNELCNYVRSIGGIVVHPHPKTMMASNDPLDYYECFGEHSYLETIYGSYDSAATAKNYELWVQILAAGKHMYTSCGSDSHGPVSNGAPATFYTREKNGLAFFNQMKSADFTAGAFGFKMLIDGHPMGSEIAYREGQILLLRAGDFFEPARKENTAYELRIYSDEGLCYASRFNGKFTQQLALKLKKRRFYRAEIVNITKNCRIAVGNPIWLDKEE